MESEVDGLQLSGVRCGGPLCTHVYAPRLFCTVAYCCCADVAIRATLVRVDADARWCGSLPFASAVGRLCSIDVRQWALPPRRCDKGRNVFLGAQVQVSLPAVTQNVLQRATMLCRPRLSRAQSSCCIYIVRVVACQNTDKRLCIVSFDLPLDGKEVGFHVEGRDGGGPERS